MVSTTLQARSADEARYLFGRGLTSCIDHLSFVHAVPVFVAMVAARDVINEVQYIFFQAPPRPVSLAPYEQTLHEEMRPVYALYREFQNATSSYYRVLTLYKTMEGLLGTMRVSVQLRAERIGRTLNTPKAIVPDHPDIATHLKQYVGAPLKKFFDGFLTKQYRDAVAHFELRSKHQLDVSSVVDAERFAQVSFLADLCVRALVERHEETLRQLK